ncbi:MAG: DHH family phosphoesterase [Acetatifactor sp.]|nr:DHH family phosphoesterase [Acetatifactor sp.]
MNPLALVELCKNRKVYIQTHNFPDPDAIGSAFGLQKLLEHYGIDSTLCHEGQIDKLSAIKLLNLCGIEMHPYEEIQADMKEEDMIILVDCQKNNGNTTDFIGDELAAIDHHPTFVKVEYEYSDLRITGACCSIISDYYRTLDIKPDVKVATALLYGLRMDTYQFARGVTAFDIDMYRYLFDYSDVELLNALESNNLEFSDLKAYGASIDTIQIYGKVGFSSIDFFCPDGLVASLSDFILSLAEVEVAIVYSLRQDGYKFSVRSEREDVHAGTLTHDALSGIGNGGGHATMAGGFVKKAALDEIGPSPMASVRKLFMNVLKEKCPAALE